MQTQIEVLEEALEESVGQEWEIHVSDALCRARAQERINEVINPTMPLTYKRSA
jgi:hypothetical protein